MDQRHDPNEGTATLFDDSEFGQLDAVETATRIARGELTAGEAAEAAHERMLRINPALNAVATDMSDAAKAGAALPGSGPFSGVPTYIKGVDDIAGMVNDRGSRAFEANISAQTDEFVAAFLDLGFTNMGRSTASECALHVTTESTLYGPTRNPWNTGHSVGGSSGGAAALVASGIVPIAHASDGGGSIRIPASACGLVGLKVSRDRNFGPSLLNLLPVNAAVHGVLSRTVRDTAHAVAALEDGRPAHGLAPIGLVKATDPLRPLRIGFHCQALHETPVSDEVSDAVIATAAVCADLGHKVEEVRSAFRPELYDDFLLYWCFLAWIGMAEARRTLGNRYSDMLFEPFTLSLARRYEERTADALPAVIRLRAAAFFNAAYAGFDVILSPVSTIAPPPIGWLAPQSDPDIVLQRTIQNFCFTQMENITGDTAISLPLGLSRDGLPIGVQASSRSGGEALLLQLAYQFETAGLFRHPHERRASDF